MVESSGKSWSMSLVLIFYVLVSTCRGQQAFFLKYIWTCHSKKSTGVTNKMVNSILLLRFEDPVFFLFMRDSLPHSHGRLVNLKRTEQSIMILVTPALFLQRQMKTSAVEKRPVVEVENSAQGEEVKCCVSFILLTGAA